MSDLLIDPDCAAGKCGSCVGGPCKHACHVPGVVAADPNIVVHRRPESWGDGTGAAVTGPAGQQAQEVAAGSQTPTGDSGLPSPAGPHCRAAGCGGADCDCRADCGHPMCQMAEPPEPRDPPSVIITPTREDWLAARRKGIGASEIAVVMGLAPASWEMNPYRLYQQKLGVVPQIDDSDQMAYGRHMEPFVAERFCARYPEFALEGDGEQLYAHPERPWQLCTPDRLAFDAGAVPDAIELGTETGRPPGLYRSTAEWPAPLAVVQCKTAWPGDEWGDEGTEDIPLHYRMQVLWEMDVIGVENAFIPVWFSGSHMRVYEIVLGDLARRELLLMREAALAFLLRIQTADPPPLDWTPATTAALRHLYRDLDDTTVDVKHQLAAWWAAARRDFEAAKRRKGLYENMIRDAMGTSRRARDPRTGLVFARRDRFDTPEKMIKRKAGTTDRLMPVAPPRDKLAELRAEIDARKDAEQ